MVDIKLKHKEYSISIVYDLSWPVSECEKHVLEGKHKSFKGRPYRRGKNRCWYCGAPNDAPDNPNWLRDKDNAAMAKAFEHSFDYEKIKQLSG